jgi:hypothetical protein
MRLTTDLKPWWLYAPKGYGTQLGEQPVEKESDFGRPSHGARAMRVNAQGSTLRGGRTASGFLVLASGQGTLSESPTLYEFTTRSLEAQLGPSTVVTDLLHCGYLDSTFLGCLADLHRKCNRTETGVSLWRRPATRVRDCLPQVVSTTCWTADSDGQVGLLTRLELEMSAPSVEPQPEARPIHRSRDNNKSTGTASGVVRKSGDHAPSLIWPNGRPPHPCTR